MAYLADVPPTPRWLDREAFPFRSRWMEIPAGRMHYIDEGRGPPILFVHGTPTWSFEWRHLVRALREGYRCVAVDHLGFGLSDRPRSAAYTLEGHAERLRAFVERLGLAQLTLVAHDFGGPIALPLAEEVPSRIARLVVINSWMWSLTDDPEMRRRGRIIKRTRGADTLPALQPLAAPADAGRLRRSPEADAGDLPPVPGAVPRSRRP